MLYLLIELFLLPQPELLQKKISTRLNDALVERLYRVDYITTYDLVELVNDLYPETLTFSALEIVLSRSLALDSHLTRKELKENFSKLILTVYKALNAQAKENCHT